MSDLATLQSIASRSSLPLALVQALDGKSVPSGLLASYGVEEALANADPVVPLTIAAHAVAQSFQQHQSLEDALSHVFAGDPKAHESPTSTAGGVVHGILADAALKVAQTVNQPHTPANREQFGRLAESFVNYLDKAKDSGGIVTQDTLNAFRHGVEEVAPTDRHQRVSDVLSRSASQSAANAPVPQGPTPKEVEEFASEMKGRGIDIDHFMENFPMYSALRYKLLAQKTDLSHYAEVNGMPRQDMLEHVRNQPHSIYPHLTAGRYADMEDAASLHSVKEQGRMPHSAEVARLATAGAKWTEVNGFYKQSESKEVPQNSVSGS